MSRVKIDGWAMLCWEGSALNRGTMIGGTTNHRLSLGRGMIEKASGTQGRAREYLPGLTSWGLDIEKMVLVDSEGSDVWRYVEKLKTGARLNVCLQVGLDYFEGDALIEQASVSAPFRGKATARMTLRGTGALEALEAALMAKYGAKFFNWRKYLVEEGLAVEGLTATSADNTAIAQGKCPPSLLADEVHPNDYGHDAIAKRLYQMMSLLGYFD